MNALGNMMSGIAIPEKTPYKDKALEVLKPLATSIFGSCIVSTEEIKLMQIRFKLMGSASDTIDLPLLRERELRIENAALPGRTASIKHENNAEVNSPASNPTQIYDRDIFSPDSTERRHKM